MIRFLDWKSGNLSALIISAILGFGGIAYQNYRLEQARIERVEKYRAERLARNAEPIENWFNQRTILVPDFSLGDDVNVVFDRDPVKQPFTAAWATSVISADGRLATVCDVSGFKNYQAGETLPVTGVSLKSIFSPSPCNWQIGKFILRTTWKISRPGYDDVIVTRSSNIFNVLPPGAQQYLLPEQVQKLEDIQ